MTRKQWLKLRRQSVGASEAAALFNLHPFHSPFSLWAEKTGQVEPEDEKNDQQEFGLAIEPYLAKRYREKTGRTVERLPKYTVYHCGNASATPDRVFRDTEVAPPNPLELKSGIFFDPKEELPAHWQVQINQQMLCTGAARGSFAILGSFHRFFTYDVERNEAFLSLLIEKIDEFWEHVKKGTPPPVDGHAATTEALKRLHPKDSGETVALPAEAEYWTAELAAVKKHIKEFEARKSELENQLKAAIGDATYGRMADGSGWSLKTTPRDGYTVEATEYRSLRRTMKLF